MRLYSSFMTFANRLKAVVNYKHFTYANSNNRENSYEKKGLNAVCMYDG